MPNPVEVALFRTQALNEMIARDAAKKAEEERIYQEQLAKQKEADAAALAARGRALTQAEVEAIDNRNYQEAFGERQGVAAAREQVAAASAAPDELKRRQDELLQKLHAVATGRTKSDAELEFEKQYQAARSASYGSATNIKGVNQAEAGRFRADQGAQMLSGQQATGRALHESLAKSAQQQEAAFAADIAKNNMSRETLDQWYAQGLADIDAQAGRSAFGTAFTGAQGDAGRTQRRATGTLADWYAADDFGRRAANAGVDAIGSGLSAYVKKGK